MPFPASYHRRLIPTERRPTRAFTSGVADPFRFVPFR